MRPTHPTVLDDVAFWVDQAAKSYERCTIRERNVEILITDHDGFRAITARGTSSSADLLRDAWALPAWCDELDAWLHAGFLKCARIIAHRLWRYVDGVRAPVYLNGHSLGGAIATVLAALMQRYGLAPAGLVTLGCPRVGFASLGRRLDGIPKSRLVMRGDPIPMVPFGLGYRHICRPTRLGPPAWPSISHHFLGAYRASSSTEAGLGMPLPSI